MACLGCQKYLLRMRDVLSFDRISSSSSVIVHDREHVCRSLKRACVVGVNKSWSPMALCLPSFLGCCYLTATGRPTCIRDQSFISRSGLSILEWQRSGEKGQAGGRKGVIEWSLWRYLVRVRARPGKSCWCVGFHEGSLSFCVKGSSRLTSFYVCDH